jgi:hypothetical protein
MITHQGPSKVSPFMIWVVLCIWARMFGQRASPTRLHLGACQARVAPKKGRVETIGVASPLVVAV